MYIIENVKVAFWGESEIGEVTALALYFQRTCRLTTSGFANSGERFLSRADWNYISQEILRTKLAGRLSIDFASRPDGSEITGPLDRHSIGSTRGENRIWRLAAVHGGTSVST